MRHETQVQMKTKGALRFAARPLQTQVKGYDNEKELAYTDSDAPYFL